MGRKNKIDSKVSCRYLSADDCPHRESGFCKYNKDTCALDEENKERRNKNWKIKKMPLIAVFSCIAIIILEYLKLKLDIQCDNDSKRLYDLYNVVIGGCFSILAASLITLFVDIPSSLQQYEMHFANMLSSNSYLKILDNKRLRQLRQDITSQMNKTALPGLPEGLVQMDDEICSLFYEPYYERYSHLVQCSIPDSEPKVIKKEHVIEYKLVNPGYPNEIATERIKIKNLIMQRDKDDKGISDFKLSYRIDDEKWESLPEEYGMAVRQLDKKIEFYTAKVYLAKNPDSDKPIEGVSIQFKKNLMVKYSYTIDVHINDRCFTKRLQHPTKLFIMNYSCSNDNIRLHGQILGTNLKQSNMSIQYLDDNSVNMVSYDWLLPDNGAVVVMLDQ